MVEGGRLQMGTSYSVPAGTLRVNAGAEFNTGGFNLGQSYVQALNLNGGTIRAAAGTTSVYLTRLDAAGGTIDATATSSFRLFVAGPKRRHRHHPERHHRHPRRQLPNQLGECQRRAAHVRRGGRYHRQWRRSGHRV